MEGIVFNIQRFSVHDGPGIRTTVFLTGCNMRCYWCHNPESWSPKPQIQFYTDKCVKCGACVEVCPTKAQLIENGRRIFLREKCIMCGKCTAACSAKALVLSGEKMSVQEVMKEVEKDRPFYDESQGGITLSGGEPLLQMDFAKELLSDCKGKGIHTAVETALNVPWTVVDNIRAQVDLFLIDVKVAHRKKHLETTGLDNKMIIDNLRKLADTGSRIWVRIPVIPGVNDDVEEMKAIADLVSGIKNIESVELLPFHNMAQSKYDSLNMEYKAEGRKTPSKSTLASLIQVLREKNLPVSNVLE
jgi:pyruvate formate lyase activating enzyme